MPLSALRPRPRSLWIRTALLALPGLAILAAGAVAWIWFDRIRTLEAGEQSAYALARVLEEQTARSFEAIDLTLMGMIDILRLNPSLGEHDPAFENSMRERLKSLPHVRALFVIGSDGFITQDTDHPATPRVSLADRPYFRAHARDPSPSVRIAEPLVSRSVGVWFVSVSRRIDRPDGSFAGIAVAAVEPRYFEKFYNDLQTGIHGSITLFRRDGILIARFPRHEQSIGKDLSSLDLFRIHLPAGDTGTYRATGVFDQVRRIVSYRTVERFPLVVSVTLSQDELLAGWRRNAVAMAGAGSAMAVLIVLLTALWLRRRAEQEQVLQHRLQTQKLEALGRMTGGAAHDFNNLMATVGSGLTLLRHASDEAEAHRIIEMVSAAIERGTTLTKQMLAFAREQELQVVETDLNELIVRMEHLLHHAAGPGIDLDFDLGTDVPLCLTDRTQFDSTLLNLVINARDAMPDGGTIRISTAPCTDGDAGRPPSLKPGPYACVSVTDTGQGMPPEVLRRAFDPFFTTKGEKGTGLGLSQVYGFVRQNGGDLTIESRPGAGTSIHLFFPGSGRGSQARASDSPGR